MLQHQTPFCTNCASTFANILSNPSFNAWVAAERLLFQLDNGMEDHHEFTLSHSAASATKLTRQLDGNPPWTEKRKTRKKRAESKPNILCYCCARETARAGKI